MSRFLKLLGPQTIQITMSSDGIPLVSWVIETTKDTVKNIQVIPGRMEGVTMNFGAELNDFKTGGDERSSKADNIGIAVKLLASNKGIRQKIGLCRLIAAAGIEFITYSGTKNNGK